MSNQISYSWGNIARDGAAAVAGACTALALYNMPVAGFAMAVLASTSAIRCTEGVLYKTECGLDRIQSFALRKLERLSR